MGRIREVTVSSLQQKVIRKRKHTFIVRYRRRAEFVAGVFGLALDPACPVNMQDAETVLVRRKSRSNAKKRDRRS